MSNITNIANYYSNLLILQYNNLPKASATINLLASVFLANGVYLDVPNAYNIDPDLGPTAVGVQLDIMGKYAGVNRYYSTIDLENYTALVPYSEALTLPSSPPAFGIDNYANYPTSDDWNGTLVYSDIVTSKNSLSDADFLTLIRLAIRNNNSNYSMADISRNIYDILGPSIIPETNGFMEIVFFFRTAITTLLQAVIQKGLLPRPMGVSCAAVTGLNANSFSFADYAGYESPWGYGFSTYADYDTLIGQTITYSMIQEA